MNGPNQPNDDLSPETARSQFKYVINLMKDRYRELMKTPEGTAIVREELGALQGIPPEQVKIEEA